jgi:uncharacterized protein DUF4386
MNSKKRTARVAGLLYLLGAATAPFSLIYLPKALMVPGDAAATASKVRASEMLLRLGILSDLVNSIVFIFVVLTLYRLLKEVDQRHAVLMVILWLVSVPISFVNTLNRLVVLILLSGADFLSGFTQRQIDAVAMLFLKLYGEGTGLASIFWGLWLLPFGILVYKSGFIPRIFGVLLIINSFAYPISAVTWLLLPTYGHTVSQLMLVPETGELWIVLWLLIKGVKDQAPREPASIPAVAQ